MSKRHNRKRTRSRPRHRGGGNAHSTSHTRTFSMDTNASTYSSYQHFPLPIAPFGDWHQTYPTWQELLREEQERERVREAHHLRFFGGEVGDEVSLLGPMLKVVTDLFDGKLDYDDP